MSLYEWWVVYFICGTFVSSDFKSQIKYYLLLVKSSVTFSFLACRNVLYYIWTPESPPCSCVRLDWCVFHTVISWLLLVEIFLTDSIKRCSKSFGVSTTCMLFCFWTFQTASVFINSAESQTHLTMYCTTPVLCFHSWLSSERFLRWRPCSDMFLIRLIKGVFTPARFSPL